MLLLQVVLYFVLMALVAHAYRLIGGALVAPIGAPMLIVSLIRRRLELPHERAPVWIVIIAHGCQATQGLAIGAGWALIAWAMSGNLFPGPGGLIGRQDYRVWVWASFIAVIAGVVWLLKWWRQDTTTTFMALGAGAVIGWVVMLVRATAFEPTEMLLSGAALIALGIACYISNIALISRYLEKQTPGLLDMDAALPPPPPDKRYLWEYTAGTGLVPKWVSRIGLAAIPLFGTGVAICLTGLVMRFLS